MKTYGDTNQVGSLLPTQLLPESLKEARMVCRLISAYLKDRERLHVVDPNDPNQYARASAGFLFIAGAEESILLKALEHPDRFNLTTSSYQANTLDALQAWRSRRLIMKK